jgi:hypothetical protein
MPQSSQLEIQLKNGPGGPSVDVSPAPDVHVASGGRVRVSVTGADQFPNFLGVEIHMPGNHKRKVMRGMLGVVPKHVFIFDEEGGDIPIGRGLTPGERHNYCVYAHFSGSVTTVSAPGSPSMIIQ